MAALVAVCIAVVAALGGVSWAGASPSGAAHRDGCGPVGEQYGGCPTHGCVVSNPATGVQSSSLQEAIDAAGAGDTLRVRGRCVGASTVTKDLTLEGVEHTEPTLDGDWLGSVLTLSDDVRLTVRQLAIVSGFAAYGGGIDGGQHTTITLVDSTVSGNEAGQSGGGIFTQNGTSLTLVDSAVIGNTAPVGGGIFSYNGGGGSVTINGSTVSGNTARVGGGVFFYYNAFALNGSRVTGNAASENGGGLYDVGGALTLTDTVVSGNTGRNGGGVYDYQGAVALNGASAVRSNTATGSGGGIYTDGAVQLVNCVAGVNVAANTPDDIYP